MVNLDALTILINAVNGIVPFAFSYILYRNYRVKQRNFYLYWFFGFLAYGVSSLINIYIKTIDPSILPNLLLNFFAFIAFTGLLVGIGELINQRRTFFRVSLVIPILYLLLFLLDAPLSVFAIFFMLPYAAITGLLLILYSRFKLDIKLLMVGWILILAANIWGGAGMIDITWGAILSVIGKTIVFYWMTRPYFGSITEGFDEFMSITSSESVILGDNFITMVETSSLQDNLGWIIDKIGENHDTGLRSILFWVEKEEKTEDYSRLEEYSNLYLFRVTEGYHRVGKALSERIMEVSNNIDELTVMIYDILEYIRVNETPVQLFFYDISQVIKRNGWKRVYSLLISLIPQFKSSNAHVYFIYNNENEEIKQEIEILRLLADRVMDIRG